MRLLLIVLKDRNWIISLLHCSESTPCGFYESVLHLLCAENLIVVWENQGQQICLHSPGCKVGTLNPIWIESARSWPKFGVNRGHIQLKTLTFRGIFPNFHRSHDAGTQLGRCAVLYIYFQLFIFPYLRVTEELKATQTKWHGGLTYKLTARKSYIYENPFRNMMLLLFCRRQKCSKHSRTEGQITRHVNTTLTDWAARFVWLFELLLNPHLLFQFLSHTIPFRTSSLFRHLSSRALASNDAASPGNSKPYYQSALHVLMRKKASASALLV